MNTNTKTTDTENFAGQGKNPLSKPTFSPCPVIVASPPFGHNHGVAIWF